VAIPDGAVQVHPGAGEAELHVADLPIEDYFNLPNALRDGHEVDATVSFDVVWSGPVTRRVSITDGTNGDQFAGQFEEDHATVTWSASNELGFSFHSNPGDFSTSAPHRAFAEVGHEENGAFFGEGDGAPAAPSASGGAQWLAPPPAVGPGVAAPLSGPFVTGLSGHPAQKRADAAHFSSGGPSTSPGALDQLFAVWGARRMTAATGETVFV
jgi:hypothetical protein